MRAPHLLLLALLIPEVVLAQTTTGNYITLQYQSRDTVVLTSANCGGTVSVNYMVVFNSGSLCSTQMTSWLTAGTSCGDAMATGDLELQSPDISQIRTGTLTFSVNSLPIFAGASRDGGSSCTTYAGETEMKLCAAYKYTTGVGQCNPASIAKPSTPLTVRFDNSPPPAPTVDEVVSLDRALLVRVTPPEVKDVAVIELQYREAAAMGEFVPAGSFAISSSSGKVNNLVNGTEYEVRAFAVDEAGNRSLLPSNSGRGTPIYTNGFWDRYRGAGGQEQGGCAVGGGGAAGLGMVLLAGIRFVSRRKRS
jgi:hypothetical protein